MISRVLGSLDSSIAASQKFLRDFRNIRGARGMLPACYTLSPQEVIETCTRRISGSRFCVKRAQLVRRKLVRCVFPPLLPLPTLANEFCRRSAKRLSSENTQCVQTSCLPWISLSRPPSRFEVDV